MDKKQYIIDSLEELELDYSINANFYKIGNKKLRFDFYIKKPYKLVILYKEPEKEIDSILAAGFTILDFSKVNPSFNLIKSTIESL